MKLEIHPAWKKHMQDQPEGTPPISLFKLGLSIESYSRRVTVINSSEAALSLLQFTMENQVSHIGYCFKFSLDDTVDVASMVTRKICPQFILLSICAQIDTRDVIIRFFIDVSSSEVTKIIGEIFRQPFTFVTHEAKACCFCCLKLGIDIPSQLWDTEICERALTLGQWNVRYQQNSSCTVEEEIQNKEVLNVKKNIWLSIERTLSRYGIDCPAIPQEVISASPDISHDVLEIFRCFTDPLIKLYLSQITAATKKGIIHHLQTVEMPWIATSAKMEWNGVLTDQALTQRVKEACALRFSVLEARLKAMGLRNARSNSQLNEFFSKLGINGYFAGVDGHKFEKHLLQRHTDKHPAIPLIIELRQVGNIQSSGLLDLENIGTDGRMHPIYQQMGADTGRETAKKPNILGVPGLLRPVIIPIEGFGIGEVDLCQIEIGVTAAFYNDKQLISMFNKGDVYSAMAQSFFSGDLSEEDRQMEGAIFKRKHPEKRNQMKVCALAIIYGTGTPGLAAQLGVGEVEAEKVIKKFQVQFNALHVARERHMACSARKGYASTISGLRRYRGKSDIPTGWEKRWLVNFPIQGSAASAFKLAGNRLDKIFIKYGARLLIPLHDSFVFVAPLGVLAEVAEITRRVMCEAVQEYFPELHPRAEVNISHPECWNKDGKRDLLDVWLQPQPTE